MPEQLVRAVDEIDVQREAPRSEYIGWIDDHTEHSEELVDLTWASSNQILSWLRQLEGLRAGGIGKSI